MADKNIDVPERYAGGVLFLETSEELPSATEVYRVLRSLGERGLLGVFSAVLFGRPKAWALDRRTTPEQKSRYVRDQREAVLRAMDEYAPDTMVVLDIDFGHTDPQLVIPYGGLIRVDGVARRITVRY
jgi:muramoyltetrapeptide carboxypeptidase LdcA involved in peptidoglycan recycling